MTRNSLRLRLLLAGVASTVAALALAAYGLALLFERHVERRLDAELSIYLNQITAHLEPSASGQLTLANQPADPRFGVPLSGLYWQIVDEQKGTVLRSRSLWDSEIELPHEPAVDDTIHHHRVRGPGNTELYLLQRRIELPARMGGGTARIAVACDTAEIANAVREFAIDLTPLLAVIGALLLAAAWIQVTIGLRPLKEVRTKLAAIRSGKISRLGSDFPDEIRPLVQEIDGLIDARDAELQRAKARAGDLAHGLRTPLQVLQSEIESLAQQGHADVALSLSTVTRTMQRTVERELARVRLASPHPESRANVATAIDKIIRVIQKTPDGERLDWIVDVPADLIAPIDRDDLSEAVGNLIENAARHARHTVTITGRKNGTWAILEVCDDGPGIPTDLLAEALRRGGRLDERGSGAGLGLAIVTDIVESWGGSLTLGNGETGLIATLRLPLPAADHNTH
ncbi:HAMP domain-containing sensor histidine kinase [Hyphomicrobium sp.]|uniref:sensor histidine kinase n=1 Tax=Hyphomicrobium sp. TaxID=82 RepID=UPI002E33DCE3|nr:HAMP domain-containing sensor histidine kinase [Hyphomicrobium sp.]HEX2840547.1 HAMP domain-containing sensor histidine kinase [Hyphomicrobium sp.]